MVNVGSNSGSVYSEQNIIDSVEFVNQIRPGQMQNYVWNITTSSWIPEPAYTTSGSFVTVTGTVINTPSIQFQTVLVSGTMLGSGALVSGGYASASITATQPIYYRYSQLSFASGTPTATAAFAVSLIPAAGYASGVGTLLTSAAIVNSGAYLATSGITYILLSGDTIVATTVSNVVSGIPWSVRIVLSQ